ncbi:C-terminal associated domain of TOPRIM [Phytophthora cactorum]|nr:C-terminal associated domain of TOPRIM [Phytophthora cactorum]
MTFLLFDDIPVVQIFGLLALTPHDTNEEMRRTSSVNKKSFSIKVLYDQLQEVSSNDRALYQYLKQEGLSLTKSVEECYPLYADECRHLDCIVYLKTKVDILSTYRSRQKKRGDEKVSHPSETWILQDRTWTFSVTPVINLSFKHLVTYIITMTKYCEFDSGVADLVLSVDEDLLNWNYVNENPALIDVVKSRPQRINLKHLALNPAAADVIVANAHREDVWENMPLNPNPAVFECVLEHVGRGRKLVRPAIISGILRSPVDNDVTPSIASKSDRGYDDYFYFFHGKKTKTMTTTNVADRYRHMTDVQHVLHRPDMYVGSCQKLSDDVFVADASAPDDKPRIVKKTIEYVPGLERIYEEALLNAFDHTVREGTRCTDISVTVDIAAGSISVMNNGTGIPIVRKEELNCYVPEMIFGMLRTGSNYDGDEEGASARLTGGKFGLGIKLANIFSSTFTLETVDSTTKKRYLQTWSNHMADKTDAKITKCSRKSFTCVTFVPDLAYFKLETISDDMAMLMKKRLVDIGFATHASVRTSFNGVKTTIKKAEKYMRLYSHPEPNKLIVDNTCERWTVGVALSNDGFQHAAFVNGIHTSLGGTHVDHVTNQIIRVIIDQLKKKKITVKPADVRNRMFVFIKAAIENPVFDSQSKETLKMAKSKFGSEFVMSDAFKNKLVKSTICKSMTSVSDQKKIKDLEKTGGTKKSRLTEIDALEDAALAGTAKSLHARLILTEGLSARTFAMSALNVIGRDNYGVFPLKGKLLNVRNVPITRVAENEEICNIVKILGLDYKSKYETEMYSLRYGGAVALTDADTDGYHISGLLINFFHHFWPKLIEREFLTFCITPIVKVYKDNETLEFYTLNNYEEWLRDKKTGGKTFRTKYFKGLGTNADCDEHVSLAFDDSRADDRKRWLIERYDPAGSIDRTKRQVGVSDFINLELSHFSSYDCMRSIPNVMDGLKPSQRKILFVAMKTIANNEMKVAQLGPKVSQKTDYHHGEKSLMDAIIGMAQDFVGSNNINMLLPLGGFGCLDPETEVLQWNGEWAKAKDIKIDDQLVGDDWTRRSVIRLTTGIARMYWVSTSIYTFKVTAGHKLTLVYQREPGRCCFSAREYKLHVIDITVQEYLGLPREDLACLRLVVCNHNKRQYGVGDYFTCEFNVIYAGVGTYCGWEITGNNRFLLKRHIVTHNSRLSGGKDAASSRYIFTKLNPTTLRLFDARDTPLLKHLYSDNMAIEPEWFAPILPMVLVNGACGIGTGFSSTVLQYNPEDLKIHILARLKGELPVLALKPWYRGFKGTIEETGPNKYAAVGVWVFNDSNKSLHITELPINKWTDTYKAFCEKLLTQDNSPLKDVRYNNTDTVVDIELIFRPSEYARFKSMDRDTLVKYFKLSSSLTSTNMHLFNTENRIERFKDVYAILDYYYSERLTLYGQHKEALITQLKKEILLADNKAAFISAVKAGNIDQRTLSESSLLELLQKDFAVDPRCVGDTRGLTCYVYLIGMSYRSFTNENADKMHQLVAGKKAELKKLEKMSPEAMWENDLLSCL